MGLKLEEVAKEAIKRAEGSRLILLIGESSIDEFIKTFEKMGGEITKLMRSSMEEYKRSKNSEQYYIIDLDYCFGSNNSSQAA